MKELKSFREVLAELSSMGGPDGVDIQAELASIGEKVRAADEARSAWKLVKAARAGDRPAALDLIRAVFDDFVELHGDRYYGDDGAIVGGIAFAGGRPVTVIANQKGRTLREAMARNNGMAHPEGYRKALRLARQAEKFGRPIVTFVDTQGPFPELESEERGIGGAIGMNLREFASLRVPVICFVVGEGGSGGALGLCVGDRVYMLEKSFFSVITPEGFAALILKDPERKKEAAAMMKLSPEDLRRFRFCDGIVSEGEGEAKEPLPAVARRIRAILDSDLAELCALRPAALVERREARIFSF